MPPLAGDLPRKHPPRHRVNRGVIAAVVALLVIGAGGYGLWLNRDDLASLVGMEAEAPQEAAATADDLPPAASEEPAEGAEDVEPQEQSAQETAGQDEPEPAAAAEPAEDEEIAALPPAEEPAEEPAAGEPAAASPAPESAALPATPADEPAAAPADGEPQKFTQRLMPDGSETDEGPAGGESSIGEGSSVAAATQAAAPETAVDASPAADGAATSAPAAPAAGAAGATSEAQASVAVGQRAIFYEERTTSASGSAEIGNIVWSKVEESPGGDSPPEPAIRAQATIPGRDVQLRMTIRRNSDQTLPASHIIEMIFLTPEGFEGGGISNVTRVSFKETEQAAGNALIGIPAKIADGFFLIALGDAPAEIETNTTLLRRQNWIDIPITYASGRRALLSMEKGIPGERVFQEVLQAWEQADNG